MTHHRRRSALSRWLRGYRRGAHRQNGFRQSVDEIAADIEQQSRELCWPRWNLSPDGTYHLANTRVFIPEHFDEQSSAAFITIAPPEGLTTLLPLADDGFYPIGYLSEDG